MGYMNKSMFCMLLKDAILELWNIFPMWMENNKNTVGS